VGSDVRKWAGMSGLGRTSGDQLLYVLVVMKCAGFNMGKQAEPWVSD